MATQRPQTGKEEHVPQFNGHFPAIDRRTMASGCPGA